MLKFVLLVALVSVAFAAPQTRESDANTLREENDDDANGNFRYGYETSNSISAVAQGSIKNAQAEPDDQILEIRGCYSYISPDGSPVVVTYVANELGFQPTFATELSACPDVASIGQNLRSPAPAPKPAPRPAPRPVPVRPAPVPARIPAPRPAPTQAPVRDEDLYKVLNEKGEVVAIIPKAQAQAKLQAL